MKNKIIMRGEDMLNIDIYSIYTTDNEYSGSNKEFFTSFDDAMEARYKYANWWSSEGDISIKLYKANSPFRCSHTWHISPEGKITEEYDF